MDRFDYDRIDPWLYNKAPMGCWGSRQLVENWTKNARREVAK